MAPGDGKQKILVVDDEANVRESLKLILSRVYDVVTAENGEAALDLLTEASGHGEEGAALPDLVIVDVMMPGLDGLGLLERMKGSFSQIPVIMLTATKAVKTAVQAMKFGAVDYLNKPFDVDELLSLIEETLQSGAADRSSPTEVTAAVLTRPNLPSIPGDFGCIVGKHPLMQEVFRKIEQLAVRDTTVLITGESGTGKELVAREIHERSPRAKGPFVALNCSAIPETLIESELFGHERGAFTHAVEKRLGHFELADGGTLFLDEIGELGLSVQVKLLRFLQEHEFYRVGRSKPIKVDVRVVAATNKSLETAVRDGKMRQDLYYRINVVNIEMPPLRERKEDIPALVTHFVNRLAPLYGNRQVTVAPDALAALAEYAWPGNVRELENVTESILALSNVSEIRANHLPARLRQSAGGGDAKESVLGGGIAFEEAERQFEMDLIMKALQKTGYVQTRAAELLGISRRILKYKMDKLGISDTPPSESN